MKQKFIMLCLACVLVSPLDAKAVEWNNIFPQNWEFLKNWPSSHWKGQNYNPSIQKNGEIIRGAINPSESMFANIEGLKAVNFIQRLKDSNIIKTAYQRKEGPFWNEGLTEDVIIELDHNFYTLSYTDQSVVADLLAKSYGQSQYLLKDASTKNIVGQITPSGLHLF